MSMNVKKIKALKMSRYDACSLLPVPIMCPSWPQQDSRKPMLGMAWFSCTMVCEAKVMIRDYRHYTLQPPPTGELTPAMPHCLYQPSVTCYFEIL